MLLLHYSNSSYLLIFLLLLHWNHILYKYCVSNKWESRFVHLHYLLHLLIAANASDPSLRWDSHFCGYRRFRFSWGSGSAAAPRNFLAASRFLFQMSAAKQKYSIRPEATGSHIRHLFFIRWLAFPGFDGRQTSGLCCGSPFAALVSPWAAEIGLCGGVYHGLLSHLWNHQSGGRRPLQIVACTASIITTSGFIFWLPLNRSLLNTFAFWYRCPWNDRSSTACTVSPILVGGLHNDSSLGEKVHELPV